MGDSIFLFLTCIVLCFKFKMHRVKIVLESIHLRIQTAGEITYGLHLQFVSSISLSLQGRAPAWSNSVLLVRSVSRSGLVIVFFSFHKVILNFNTVTGEKCLQKANCC